MTASILTLNAGSSSLKFALFDLGSGNPEEVFRGQIEGLHAAPMFSVKWAGPKGSSGAQPVSTKANTHAEALHDILNFVHEFGAGRTITAVGHRVVHGGTLFEETAMVDAAVLGKIRSLSSLAPLHQPHNIECIEAAQAVFSDALQVACFDTAFHRTHSWVNETFGLPREYYDAGIRRYGFHGLSYEHICRELKAIAPEIADGRVIAAHLGNGASMCAISGGKSIASTMSFTPLDGLAMGTRCGQIDSGVVLHLLTRHDMSVDEVANLLHKGSGLKGMSGISHDMREIEQADTEAGWDAIDYFVHRARCELGALTAILGGLDVLVFSGGIGERGARVRARICNNFQWLGMKIDARKNRMSQHLLSAKASRVKILIIPANEEMTIARHSQAALAAHRTTRREVRGAVRPTRGKAGARAADGW